MEFYNKTSLHPSNQTLARFASSSETVLLPTNDSPDLSYNIKVMPEQSKILNAVLASLVAIAIIVGVGFLFAYGGSNGHQHKNHGKYKVIQLFRNNDKNLIKRSH